ncbi:S41 family peptidase [Bradyrhizobium sp. LHD-71]|uniref:S41 family peptidase n=1 Tax=Bradyrhizobium sp. LHD-71 TaxID=3072141 RepID=UPI00280D97BE|nr:S41 family peptidase [Bradyrhizobium sp. LHD-71]MDQ8728847.1 S41 family peptidase [Bradyrhizobium sp. LHD-71]
MRKASLRLLGVAAGTILSFLVIQAPGFSAAHAATDGDTYSQLNLLGEVFERLKREHVEKVDDAKLVEGAIKGMLESLDPHSRYMDAKAWRDMQVTTSGEFGGVGVEITAEDDLVQVIAPLDGTPAARAGIMSGDLITHIDDRSIHGVSLEEVSEWMKGPINTQVRLKVIRKGVDVPVDIALTREVIRLRSVSYRIDGDDIGYVRISRFSEQTTSELHKALADIAKRIPREKLSGYVVDLRNNPGGLLEQAVSVSSAFMARGEVVSIRGRSAADSQRFTARGGDLTRGKPLVVLINGGSASASEIVAGALHDHKRATLVGTRSFGKGSVQTLIPLGTSKGALAITTARYFTPSGRSIQAQGIMPDLEILQDVPDALKGRSDVQGEASMPGHLSGDSEERPGSQSYVPREERDDKALSTAFSLLRGSVSARAVPN